MAATYVITAMIAQYFNVVVLIVQAFQKIPALRNSPDARNRRFAGELLTLAFFIAYTFLAAVRFRLEPSTEKSAPLNSQFHSAVGRQCSKPKMNHPGPARPGISAANSGLFPVLVFEEFIMTVTQQNERNMRLDTSHPGRPGLDELVPSRYA